LYNILYGFGQGNDTTLCTLLMLHTLTAVSPMNVPY
jgi:hypothetical protein